MNPPTTSTIDQNYFKSPTETTDAYASRIQTYNANKTPSGVGGIGSTDTKNPNAKAGNDPSKVGQSGYDVFGNPVGGTSNSSGSSSTYKPTDDSQDATNNDPAVMAAQQLVKDTQAFNQHQDNIQNGVIPLSAGEQAQIDGLKQQYQQMISDQQDTNQKDAQMQNLTESRQGRSQYMPMVARQNINDVSSKGAAKVTALQTEMASKVAAMTQSFKDADIKASKDAFDETQTAQKALTDAIQKHVTDVQAAIDKANAAKIAADKVTYDEVTKPIQDTYEKAVAAGAPADVRKAIQNAQASGDVNGAINAAGDYLQTATGTLGDYLQYKHDALSKGLTPDDYTSYQDKQNAKDEQNKANLAYAQENAKNQADANNTSSDKVQQKLEQQGRQVVEKELSARTGSLGVENGKVAQGNHINALVTKYYDPKTGNYNVPTAQYTELALGLANMLSSTGQSSEADRTEIKSKTAAGDFKGALQYITGEPQNGNTQAIIKNLIDSVDRQAATAVRNRQASLDNMISMLPTDLEQSRKDALIKSTKMVAYEGADRVSKTNVDDYVKSNPAEAENVAKLYAVPGATDQDIEAYLKAQGKISDSTDFTPYLSSDSQPTP